MPTKTRSANDRKPDILGQNKKEVIFNRKTQCQTWCWMRQCKLYFRNSFQNRTLDQPLPVLHQGFGGTPSYPDVHTPVYPVRDPDTLFGAHGRRRRVRHRMRSTAHRGKASAAGPPCPDFSSIRDNPKGTEGTSGWLFKHMLGYAGDRTPTSQTLPEHPH